LLRAAAGGRVIIAATTAAPDERVRAVEAADAAVWRLPPQPDGRVPLDLLLRRLAEVGVNHVLVEGGAELNASLLASGLVDRLVLFVAPKIIGGRDAIGLVGGEGLKDLDAAVQVEITAVRSVGRGLQIEARPRGPGRNGR
jgi:diaminohydroxyphosphoribosylaminopyrimidine deaminase/5-amino-6-(5-phosphoribosylamino)uracil reductase